MDDVAPSGPRATSRPRPQPTDGRSVLRAEVVKTLRLAWAGRTGMYVEIPLFALGYFVVVLFIGRGRVRPELLAPTLIGMVAAIVLHQQLNRTFWGVLAELQAGTFERMHLSPVPPGGLMLARQASVAVQALAVGAVLAVLVAVPAALVWHVDLRLGARTVQALVPLAAAVVGGAGLSLAVAGLTLVLRRLEILVEMVFVSAVVFGGALVPLGDLPGMMGTVGRLLFPVAQPIAYARRILIDGRRLTGAEVDWGLSWLVGQPLLLVGVGLAALQLGLRAARRRGTLARY